MSTRRIIETFEGWRSSGIPMVLATVFETLGSTYSKAGHRIVIADGGDYQGLVSGGCLEGDMAERARRVIADKRASAVTYDLRDDADDVFGLGVGCNGLIRVLLQPLTLESDYEPLTTLSELMRGREAIATATVIESGDEASDAGATLVYSSRGEPVVLGRVSPTADMARCAADVLTSRRPRFEAHAHLHVLYAPLPRVSRVLILGAGLDSVPLVNMAAELGWWLTVCDHRPAYLERRDLTRADELKLIEPSTLAKQVDLAAFDAALVMSHHLATDEAYLRQLASVPIPYVGVLGPRDRKHRLLEALGTTVEDLAERLHGPVGFDIGASSPESIALSILAELQAVFARQAKSPTGR